MKSYDKEKQKIIAFLLKDIENICFFGRMSMSEDDYIQDAFGPQRLAQYLKRIPINLQNDRRSINKSKRIKADLAMKKALYDEFNLGEIQKIYASYAALYADY